MLTSSCSSSSLSSIFHPRAAPASGALEACGSALGSRRCVCSPATLGQQNATVNRATVLPS